MTKKIKINKNKLIKKKQKTRKNLPTEGKG